jgi:hypothetical protein
MRDQTRNIETFKVGTATKVNEFDFHKHQEEMSEHHDELMPAAAAVETTAERVTRVTKKAHEKVLKRKKRR